MIWPTIHRILDRAFGYEIIRTWPWHRCPETIRPGVTNSNKDEITYIDWWKTQMEECRDNWYGQYQILIWHWSIHECWQKIHDEPHTSSPSTIICTHLGVDNEHNLACVRIEMKRVWDQHPWERNMPSDWSLAIESKTCKLLQMGWLIDSIKLVIIDTLLVYSG